ncbi:MAG TPA: hypothetical protein VGN46_04135 [Luteibacter sp.]|jgi:hypothetical protein|uniref:hypothetical protein n=1 Tax=Luteibacter sp. TaxID=1886636 RepID=UPI002F3E8B3B
MLGQRVLIVYTSILTAAVVVALLTGFARVGAPTFDEINVQRINLREPDGTLRMVIANSTKLPGVIVRGNEQPKVDRPQAGMLFFNDEGTENGGLIFGGRRDAKGDVVDAGGSLSFDRYNANQVVQLLGVDDKENHMAGLVISDSQENGQGERRLWAGRTADGASRLSLMDANGKKRVEISVGAKGEAEITFLDADGHSVKTISGSPTISSPASQPGAP